MQFARGLKSRERERRALDDRNRELDLLVRQRTQMLFNLSSRLQEVAEREKAALARELHDELGGLLVATKIDVSWLRRRSEETTDTAMRWDRVLRCLDEGLDLKRRVIENLRPTLLDNVGLVAALRWLVDESVRRAGLECREHYDEPLPELTPDARIAVFRAVQECLMNVIKHAGARSVDVRVFSHGLDFRVVIRDDGSGIDEARITAAQSHGLLGTRHRIEALGGQLWIHSPGQGQGTEVEFSLPWDRIRQESDHGPGLARIAGAAAVALLLSACGGGPAAEQIEQAVQPEPAEAPVAMSYEVAIAIAAANRNRALEQCDTAAAVRRRCRDAVLAEWETTRAALQGLREDQG
jgi:nitrate/nitrite-specific signal transduction histidine kinase